MSLRNFAAFLVCCASSCLVTAQTTEATTPVHDPRIGQIITQLAAVRTPHQTAISPDAHWIAWTVAAEHGTEVQVAPLDDLKAAHRVTACDGDGHGSENEIAWSPDSKKLAFFSNCNSDHQQGLYIGDPGASGPAKRLAVFHGYADSPAWSPDGKSIGLLYVEGATRPAGALAAMKPPAGVIGVEGLEVQRVAVVDADSGEMAQVTPANLHVYEFDWSQDAKKLAYVAAAPPGENNWWVAKLYTQTIAGGDAGSGPRILVDPNEAASPVHGLQLAVPRWSPDGSRIAFISGLMSDQGSTGGDIYVVPAGGGAPKNITPGSKVSHVWLRWMWNRNEPAQAVYAEKGYIESTEVAGGSERLSQIYIPTGESSAQSRVMFDGTANDGRLAGSMSVSNDQMNVAYITSSFSSPPEVVVLNRLHQQHNTIAVTHYNDGLKPAWGKAESVEWKSDHFDVQGWLLYPANYDPAKKYPLVVMVHGGPSSVAMQRWPGVGFGSAPFSALGYFVLMPNPRGSFGQGEAFTQANRKDFGYGDLRDILAGVDTVTKKYPVDPERVGITGWSYGGFMTMFSVTQTNRFRAAVAGAGVSNWQSYYGENSIDQWMIPFFGASVYDDPAVYAKSSAINFIHKVKTPSLVVVGDRDGECPAPQSFEFWHALRDAHVPTQLVVYPNEGHHFVQADHQRDVLERALSWFEQYMPAR